MPTWLQDIAGPNFAPAVLWTLLALVVLVIVLVIVRIVRSMTFGTFVAGGRNRKTRLAVMDAAAVDSHRRLVLVRRDDVEHLFALIRRLRGEGIGLIYISHFLEEVRAIADVFTVLRDGRSVADGQLVQVKGDVKADELVVSQGNERLRPGQEVQW